MKWDIIVRIVKVDGQTKIVRVAGQQWVWNDIEVVQMGEERDMSKVKLKAIRNAFGDINVFEADTERYVGVLSRMELDKEPVE